MSVKKTIARSFTVETIEDGISVQAQYAPNANPTSSQIHNVWQDGDLFMRTRETDSTTWSAWHRIVGENGGETDYSFGISQYRTTENAQTAPSDVSSWSDAPLAVTTAKPYLWSKVQQKSWNESTQQYIVDSTRYIRLTGEEGVVYDIQTPVDSIHIGENQTSATLSGTAKFYKKEGTKDKVQTVFYYGVYKRTGTTFTKVATGNANSYAFSNLAVANTVNAVVIYLFASSYTGTDPESQTYLCKREMLVVDAGNSPYFADLDNEMDSIACANDGKPSSEQTVETNVKLYRGSTALSPTLAVKDDSTSGAAYTSGTAKDGITVTWNNTTGNIKFKFGTSNSRTKTETFCIILTVTDNGATITRYLYFTVNCIRAALDGNPAALYRLVPSVSSVVKKNDGTYSVSTVSCTRQKNVGGTITDNTTDGTITCSLDGGGEQSYTNNTAINVSSFTKSIQFIYKIGTTVVDRETILLVADGVEGKGYKAIVYRDNWSTTNWDNLEKTEDEIQFDYERVYANGSNNGTTTSEIRNGSVSGDIFLVVGNATDTNVHHELTYRCSNNSGKLKGVCISHRLLGSNPNLLKRTVFDRGLDFVKEEWTASGNIWNYISINSSTDKMVDGKKSILINATSINTYQDIIQNVITRVKPSTWYTLSFNYFATNSWTSYIYSTTSSPCVDRSAGFYVDGVYVTSIGTDGAKSWAADSNGKRHTLTFKTASSFPTSYVEIRLRCWAGGTLNVCMPKLEIGMNATPYTPHDEDMIGGTTYAFVFTDAYARLNTNNIVEGNLAGYAYKYIGGGKRIALANTTIRYGYILDDSDTYHEEATNSNGYFNTQEWFTGDVYTDNDVKSSPSIFAAIIIDNEVVHVEYVTIAKQVRGKVGRFYYYAGDFDSSDSTTNFVVTDAQSPYFYYNNNYWVYNPETNPSGGITTMSAMGTPSPSSSSWKIMTSDFKYLITEAIFGSYAKFGSFVINGDWMLSTNGRIGDNLYEDGADFTGTLVGGSTFTVKAYTLFNSLYPTGEGASVVAWTGEITLTSSEYSKTITSAYLSSGVTYRLSVKGSSTSNVYPVKIQVYGNGVANLITLPYRTTSADLTVIFRVSTSGNYDIRMVTSTLGYTGTVTICNVTTIHFAPNYAVNGLSGTTIQHDGIFTGFVRKRKTKITTSNIDQYKRQDITSAIVLDFDKCGSFIELDTGTSSYITLPLLSKYYANKYTSTQKDQIRSYIGTTIIIYNNSGTSVPMTLRVNSNGGSTSGSLQNGNCVELECCLAADEDDGYEIVYWKVISYAEPV